jgi:hypothetical protein
MAVWREGTTGPLSDEAVDMMDNARALPTRSRRDSARERLGALLCPRVLVAPTSSVAAIYLVNTVSKIDAEIPSCI